MGKLHGGREIIPEGGGSGRGVVRAFSKGGRGGKNLGPKRDGVLGRKIFDFLTSLDAFSGHFLTIL